MSARYRSGKLKINPKQFRRMHSAFVSGSPVGLVLGSGSDSAEIEVILTPKQCEMIEGGAKRIKFSHAQLRRMAGAGVFGDLGEAAKPMVETAITGAISASPVGPAIGSIAGPLVSGLVGPLIDTIGREIDYAISKKPDFKQLAANRSKAKAAAKQFVAADPETQQATFKKQRAVAERLAAAPSFAGTIGKAALKNRVGTFDQFAALQQQNLGLETDVKQLKKANKAKFMENYGKGGAKCKGGYRAMTPKQRAAVRAPKGGRSTVGQEASNYIASQLNLALKN